MFTRKTLTGEVIDRLVALIPDSVFGLCMDGPDWMEQFRNEPIGNALDKLTNGGWAVMALRVLGGEIDNEFRDALVSKITDPMQAFTFYIENTKLSAKNEARLRSRFEGKLPKAEAELKSGQITREKR